MSTDKREDVLAAIRLGCKTNKAIRTSVCGAGAADRYMREVDSALQKLRKSGVIASVRGEWCLADQRPCTHCGGSGKEPTP